MSKMPDRPRRTPPSLPERLKKWDDHQTWRDFNDTYWKLLYNTAVAAGLNDSEAKDAMQETNLTVARQIAEFRYDPVVGSFQGWLMRIHQRRIADQFRKRPSNCGEGPAHFRATQDSDRTPTVERVPDLKAGSIEYFWDAHCAAAIQDAALEHVKRLVSAKQFQIFDLYVVKEWSVEEITAKLRVSAGQVYLAKTRVGKLMERELQRLWKEGF